MLILERGRWQENFHKKSVEKVKFFKPIKDYWPGAKCKTPTSHAPFWGKVGSTTKCEIYTENCNNEMKMPFKNQAHFLKKQLQHNY